MSIKSNTPLISVCIPTFNRAGLLEKTLESISNQLIFTETFDIEVVISDNYSTDNTRAVVDRFSSNHPGKVRQHRQSKTISATANYQTALSTGSGLYLKLHNDNLTFRNGSLAEIAKIILATATEKPIVFFTNGPMRQNSPLEALSTMNDFVRRISFYSTWIGGFGMWRDEFNAIPNFLEHEESLLAQTHILFHLLSNGKRTIAAYENYFLGLHVEGKGGYNIAKVFGQNYLNILKPHVQNGSIDQAVFELEKQALLINHIIPYYFDRKNNFEKSGFFRYMKDYSHDDYFFEAIESIALGEY